MPTYYNEKTKKYYCKFYYTDWQGIRRQKKKEGFTLARDAKAYEQDFLNKAAGDCSMKFSALYENYIEDYKARRKPTSVYCREYAFKKHFLPVFGNMPLTAITPVTIRKWQNDIINAGYSATYQHALNAYLSAAFNYAVKYYSLKENPVKQAGTIGKSHAGERQFWTKQEFKQFLVTVENKPEARMAFLLLYWTGMRIGELLALTYNDIDLEKRTISINKSYQRLDGRDIITPPKTPKSKRIVTIPPFLAEELREYMFRLYGIMADERMFRFTKSYMEHEIIRGIKASGVKRIRLHDLRHSHASLLVEMGFTPLAIADRLGHEKIETTLNTYSHLYPNKQGELADKLEIENNREDEE